MKVYIAFLHAALVLGSSPLTAAELQVPEDYPKIQTAIDAAKSGDVIFVAPGRYAERIKLNPGITVRSVGVDEKGKLGLTRAEATIIDGGGAQGGKSGVEMAEGARLDGFTVTHVGVFDEEKWQENWSENGANQSHEHIGGFGVPGIAVTGVTCSVVNNIVHHIGDTGIAIRGEKGKRCSPNISGNVCFRNMGGGIGSMKGSTAYIDGNTCFENFYAGIGHDNANPVVTNNDCYGNIRAGIGISEGACPVVRDNRCYRNRRSGIGIRTTSATRPIVQGNDCYENEMSGIGIDEDAEPSLLGNRCHDNKLAGIGCRNHARPLLQGNHCKNNQTVGIAISGKSHALVIENVCAENKLVALAIPGESSAVVIGNTFTRSSGMPPIVVIPHGSSATLIGNTIEGGGITGVMIDGEATLTENTLKGSNGRFGIWIREKGEAVLSANQISGYKKAVNDQGGSGK